MYDWYIQRLISDKVYVLDRFLVLRCNCFQFANLPSPQEPHTERCRDVHQAREDLGVQVDVAASLAEFERNRFRNLKCLLVHRKVLADI